MDRLGVTRPRTTLVVAAVVTLIAALGLPGLRLRTDGHALIPSSDPRILADEAVRARFGYADPFVILIRAEGPAGIYTTETLDLVAELSKRIVAIEGLSALDLTSLATEHHYAHKQGTLKRATLLEVPRQTTGALATLREAIDAIGLYTGTLISGDESATALYVRAPTGPARTALYRELERLVATSEKSGHRIDIIGAPAAEILLGDQILADLGVPSSLLSGGSVGRAIGMVPLSLLVLAVVFFVAFRGWVAVALPMIEVGAAMMITFGVMGWLGVPVYLTTTVMPVILIAMGISDEVHIFHHYRQGLAGGPDVGVAERVAETMAVLRRPIVQTSVTTAVAFLAFGLSSMAPVSAFGLFTALGILVCMVWSLTVIPAMLALIPPGLIRGRAAGSGRHRRVWQPSPLLVWAVLLPVLLLAVSGITKLEIRDSWTGGFARDSALRQATEYFDRQFHGIHALLIAFDGSSEVPDTTIPGSALGNNRFHLPGELVDDPKCLISAEIRFTARENPIGPRGRQRTWSAYIETAHREGEAIVVETPRRSGSPKFWIRPEADEPISVEIEVRPFLDPGTLARIASFANTLRSRPEVGGVLDPRTYLETTAFMIDPERPDARELPGNPRAIESIWSKLRFMRGEERLHRIVSEDFQEGLVVVFVRDADYRGVAELIDAVEVGTSVSDVPTHTLGGDLAVSQSLIARIVETQSRSLWASLLGILLVASLFGRSLRHGFLVLSPSALAVAIELGVMGWLGIPIGVATSMFAGMTLGVGVDFAVHFLDRQKRLQDEGKERDRAILKALAQTAHPIMVNAIALAAGFGLLLFSRVPANTWLGLLLACGVLTCAAVTLCLLPTRSGKR